MKQALAPLQIPALQDDWTSIPPERAPTEKMEPHLSQPKNLAQTDGQYPLAFRQQDPSGAARAPEDVLALTLRVQGPLRIDCLKGALEDVVERHEALRTRVYYDEEDGNLGYQEVLPPLPVPLAVQDVEVKPGRSRDEIAVGLANILATEGMPYTLTPSVLRHPPPLRRPGRGAHPARAPPLHRRLVGRHPPA